MLKFSILSKKPSRLLIALGSLLLIALSFSPIIFNGFASLDDSAQIIFNHDIRSLSWTSIQKIFSSFYLGMYQPLATLSFALEYQLWGINAQLSHTFNLLLHLINAWLVWSLVRQLTKRDQLAYLAALIWAIQPVQVETVAWSSARSNLLMSGFYLATLWHYEWSRQLKKKSYWWLAFFVLALLSKASALTLPAALVALDYYGGRLNWRAIITKTPPIAFIWRDSSDRYDGED